MQYDNIRDIRYCVIIPTYNHCQALGQVIKSVLEVTTDVIVVNDGSTDNTAEILSLFQGISVISYSVNRGKGYALKKGFREAKERGFDYAVTIDSDGQHRAEEISLFVSEVEKHPGSIIVGSRNLLAENMPGKNSFANNFSNFWFRLQTGNPLPDTQSGFRLYPVEKVSMINTLSRRYEYELEILVRLAWKGMAVRSIPVSVIYQPEGERTTHFRPFADFVRITVLNTILTTIAICVIIPRNIILRVFVREKKF